MSGIEIVGLALAVVPILIAVAEKTKLPKREDFMANLCFEIWSLNATLTKIANLLPEELRAKVTAAHSSRQMESAWESKEVARALQQRLGIGFDPFRTVLASTLDGLESLLEFKSLRLRLAETLSSRHSYRKLSTIRNKSTKMSMEDWSSAIRFTVLETGKSHRLLQLITDNNTTLEKIASVTGDMLLQTPDLSQEQVVLPPHLHIRPSINKLFTTIEAVWRCDCHWEHEARLCLLHCSNTGPIGDFGLVLFMSVQSRSEAASCRWLQNQLRVSIEPEERPQIGRGVRFSNIGTSTAAGAGSVRNRKRTKRFCYSVMQADRNLVCPQFLLHEGCLYDVTREALTGKPMRAVALGYDAAETTLALLLKGQRKFKTKEKRILAVILASSLLHFAESPWLEKGWTKENISFFNSSSGGAVDLQRPYLTAKFEASVAPGIDEDNFDALFRAHPNPSVLSLGILLLEIELHSTIESQRTRDDLDPEGNPNVNTDYWTALRLFEEIEDNMYKNHRNAISACLKCNFFDVDTVDANLNNLEFRQQVYSHVVRPLEQELEWAYELTPDQLVF